MQGQMHTQELCLCTFPAALPPRVWVHYTQMLQSGTTSMCRKIEIHEGIWATEYFPCTTYLRVGDSPIVSLQDQRKHATVKTSSRISSHTIIPKVNTDFYTLIHINSTLTFFIQGLANPQGENLCYLNATLQCLHACGLHAVLANTQHEGRPLTTALQAITRSLTNADDTSCLTALYHLPEVQTIREKLKAFNNQHQHDPHEFFTSLVNAISVEVPKSSQSTTLQR